MVTDAQEDSNCLWGTVKNIVFVYGGQSNKWSKNGHRPKGVGPRRTQNYPKTPLVAAARPPNALSVGSLLAVLFFDNFQVSSLKKYSVLNCPL